MAHRPGSDPSGGETAGPQLVGLSDAVHQRVRLAVLAELHRQGEMEFLALKERLGVTDGNLSRHLAVLQDGGLVTERKGYVGRRPRTWVALSSQGSAALVEEVEVLRRVVAEFR